MGSHRLKFASIARLMRSDRYPIRPRGTRGKTAVSGGGGGGAGGGTAVTDPPEEKEPPKLHDVAQLSKKLDVAVPDPFKFDPNDEHPEKAVGEAVEKLRETCLSLNAAGKLVGETFAKVTEDVEKVQKLAWQAREIARDAAAKVPGPDASKEKIESLAHVGAGLRLSYDRGITQTGGEGEDKMFGPAFGQFTKRGFEGEAQYVLLTSTASDLGITDEGTKRALKRLHALHDACVFMNLTKRGDPEYAAAGASKSLPWYPELQSLAKKFMGALSDATAGEGKEWVPVNILSATVQELIELQLSLAGLFRRFPMAGPTVKWPVQKAHMKAYYIRENVADDGNTANASLIASSLQTTDATFTARKLAALTIPTAEWEFDAVVNVPRMLEEELAYAIAAGIEDGMFSGQMSGTIDGTAPNDVDPLGAWDGIRKAFKLTGLPGVDAGGGGIIAEDLAAVFGAQGAFGFSMNECFWTTGAAGTARLLVTKDSAGNPVALSFGQAGQKATWITGQVAEVFGRPLVPCKHASETLDASGVIPAVPSDKTAVWHVNRRCGVLGERRGVLISRSEHVRFIQDQLVYKGVGRFDFEWIYAPSNTNRVVNALLNVKAY